MKKILLTVAVAAAIMTVGCSTAADREEKAEQSLQYKIENCTNPDSLKIYVSRLNHTQPNSLQKANSTRPGNISTT